MSTTFWKWSPWMWMPGIAAVGVGLFSNAFTPLNTDLGWLLAFGREYAAAGHLPFENGLSFVEPHHPQVMHEWLACVLAYRVHQTWGTAGLIVCKWLLLSLTLATMTATVYAVARNTWVRLLVLMGMAQWLWIGFELLRPQLLSWLFMTFVVWCVVQPSRLKAWSLVPLTLLWANVHGAFMLGIPLAALGLFLAQVEQRQGWAAPLILRPREWMAIVVLSAAATLLNPYGLNLLVHTYHHASDPIRLTNREWLPLWNWSALFPYEKNAVFALAAVSLLSVWCLPRRWLRGILLCVLAVGLSVSASRHLRLAPILLAPVLAASLEQLLQKFPSIRMEKLEPLAHPLGAAVIVLTLGLWASQLSSALALKDMFRPNPANAIAVMKLNGFGGKIWNDFDWGGLLVWALPESRVACDGRNVAAYSPEFLGRCILFGLDGADPLPLLRETGAEWVLLPRNNPAIDRLEPTYGAVFCDAEVCLFSTDARVVARRADLRLPETTVSATSFF